jgi:hypothetical protein
MVFICNGMIKTSRVPFVALAILCLLAGLWSGLNRIGWSLAPLPAIAHHGAIMVGGFLGTLISLEKIIPLKQKFLYSIPLTSALSVVFFIVDQPSLAILLLTLASIGFAGVLSYYFSRQRSLIYILMLAGAAQWLIGNTMLLTKQFYPLAFPWWMGFVLFIITSERLELMNFLPVSSSSKKLLISLLVIFVIGVLLSFHGVGNVVCGISVAGVSLWLMKNDLVGINIRKHRLTKFVAVSLLAGYIALLLTGVLLVTLSNQWFAYDVIVHTFFIGFVFSMIFAHGPVILPGVLGTSIKPFHKILYVWLFAMQGSWVLRIFADVLAAFSLRQISGMLSTSAIVAYFISMVVITFRSRYAELR